MKEYLSTARQKQRKARRDQDIARLKELGWVELDDRWKGGNGAYWYSTGRCHCIRNTSGQHQARQEGEMNDDRAMQIINNVAEEWADHGQTNFATKDELCQTIHWLRKADGEQIQTYLDGLHAIVLKAVKTMKDASR